MVTETLRAYSTIDFEGYESQQRVLPGSEFDHLVGMKTENLQFSERKLMVMWAFENMFPDSDFDEVWFTYSDFPEAKGYRFREFLEGWSYDHMCDHRPTYNVSIATDSKTRSVDYYIRRRDKNYQTVKLSTKGDSMRLHIKGDDGWDEAYGSRFNEVLLGLVGRISISAYEWDQIDNPYEY